MFPFTPGASDARPQSVVGAARTSGASAARCATRRRGRAARRRPRRRRRHEADLADALDAVRRLRLGHLDEDAPRSAARPWPAGCRGAQRHVGGEAGRRVGREVLGQRVAEAHVHRALDLALAQQRVDRLADVVDGDDLARSLPVSRSIDDQLRRRSRTRSGSSGSGWPGRRACCVQSTTVLALVVDVGAAAVGERGDARRRAPSRRPSACRGEPVVWPKPSSRVVSTMTSMRSGSMPSSCDGDLQRDGVHALAHLGPAVAHLDRAVARGSARPRRGDLAEPVAEAGVLQARGRGRRPCPRRGPRRTCGLHRVEARLGAAAAVVHDLAGAPHLAGLDHVALAHLPAADADLLGQPIDHALHRELRLVGAEAAERAAHRVVGADGDGVARRSPARGTGPLAWPAARSSTFMPTDGVGAASRRSCGPAAR